MQCEQQEQSVDIAQTQAEEKGWKTLTEVEPEHAVEEAEKFVKKSICMEVAYVQHFNNPEKLV